MYADNCSECHKPSERRPFCSRDCELNRQRVVFYGYTLKQLAEDRSIIIPIRDVSTHQLWQKHLDSILPKDWRKNRHNQHKGH